MILLFLQDVILKSMGPFLIPMVVLSLIILIQIVYVVYLKFNKNQSDTLKYRKSLNTLLVIGSFNLALGMIGQITGIWDAIDAIKEAGDINVEIVLTGIKFSFGTTIYGLITFMVATLVWLALTYLPVKK